MIVKFVTAIKKLKRFLSLPQVAGGASPGPIFRPIFTKLETVRDFDDDGDSISNEEY